MAPPSRDDVSDAGSVAAGGGDEQQASGEAVTWEFQAESGPDVDEWVGALRAAGKDRKGRRAFCSRTLPFFSETPPFLAVLST